jgi:hypothetical protein
MFIRIIDHSIKSLSRNLRLDANIFIRIISSLSIAYLYFAVFYLGLNFKSILILFRLRLDFIVGFNSILIYLFLLGMLLLYFFLRKISNTLIPYLHLPINRSKIVSYILVFAPFNFFNFGIILFIFPFAVKYLLPVYGIQNLIYYIAGVLLILMSVTYFILIIRCLSYINSLFSIIPFGLVLLVFGLKTIFLISFETISNEFFKSLLNGNTLLIIYLLLSLFGLLVVSYTFLLDAIYRINSENPSKNLKVSGLTFLFHNLSFYALLEIKLISRNRRLKGFFISAIGFLFLFYAILQKPQSSMYFSFIIFIILSGIFGLIFSQYLFSWESSYFDFILSTKFDIIKYLKAKYIIYVFLGFLVFVFFLPLIIQKKIDLHLFCTALIFNSCVGYFVMFFVATYNCSRIDLNNNMLGNLQGWNGMQILSIFVIIFLPYFTLILLTAFTKVTVGLFTINILCLIFLLFQRKWFRIILNQLAKRKYINLAGYRK